VTVALLLAVKVVGTDLQKMQLCKIFMRKFVIRYNSNNSDKLPGCVIRITGFLFENKLHWQFELETNFYQQQF
jgi:hypothetical protein